MAAYTFTKDGEYNISQLQQEINGNLSIIPSCHGINATGNQIECLFTADLSTDEQNTLASLIDTHIPRDTFIPVSELPISPDTNKLAVQASAKPLITNKTTYAIWAGAGDNLSTHEIGGGELLNFDMVPGQATTTKSIKFDSLHGRVWINEGYLRFENAGSGDYVSSTINAPATQLQQLVNLDLIVEDNWVKYSSSGPGTGTHGFAATPVLVPRTFSNDGDWDYDGTNLLPNFAGTGAYKISDIDRVVHRYVNHIPCRGTCSVYFNMASDDTAELVYPYFISITFYNVSNTTWNAQVLMEIYRERTVVP
jgi:hypothetical protein